MSECPYCLGDVAESASACRHCGRDLYLIRPLLARVEALEAQLAAAGQGAPESAGEAEAAPAQAARAPRWSDYLDEVFKFILLPMALLLVAHVLVTIVYDLDLVYLRLFSILVPLPFGFWLFQQRRSMMMPWFAGVLFLAMASVTGMSAITGMVDDTPVLPQDAFEWREFLEYSASIAFSFLTGMLLAAMGGGRISKENGHRAQGPEGLRHRAGGDPQLDRVDLYRPEGHVRRLGKRRFDRRSRAGDVAAVPGCPFASVNPALASCVAAPANPHEPPTRVLPPSMKLLASTRLALLALLAALAPAQALAARHALLIGNDNYQSVPILHNARADADAMGQALRKAGYQVTVSHDRSLKQMKDDVRQFKAKLRGGDEVVVFYSGHGVQIEAMNYLLPVDVRADSEDQVKDDGLALSKLLDDLRAQKPAFTLAVIDACRDNPFTGTGRAIGGRGLTGVAGASGQMVIYSAGEGQQALDRLGDGDNVRNGVFTRVFIKEMEAPGVPIDQVARRVREQVNALAQSVKHEQVPAIYDQVIGQFFFYQPAASAQAPATPAPVVPLAAGRVAEVDAETVELLFWESIKNSNDPDELRAYLEKYPSGNFAGLAKARIRRLAQGAGAAPAAAAPAAAAAVGAQEQARLAAEQAAADRLAAEKAAAEKAAADKAAQEQARQRAEAQARAEAERAAAERAAAEKARLAAEKAAADKAAAEKLAAEKAAQERARLEAEKAAAEQARRAAEQERARLEAQKAAEAKAAAEKAAAAQAAAEKARAEEQARLAAEQERQRLAEEQARADAARREAERLAAEKEQQRLAAERAAAEKLAAEKAAAEKARLEAERAKAAELPEEEPIF